MIINEIGYEVRNLQNNIFLDKSGNASQLIYGEKGIGKSSSLTLSTMAIWLHYPNVIPIYIEYTGSSKEYKSPTELICQHLQIKETTPLSECLKMLNTKDEYVVIIVDELEQLYSGIDNKEKRKKILDDLQELGSQTTGRAYTFICGSSSLMPVLISKNAIHDVQLTKEFPMIEFSPNLNGKKYSSFRVHRGENLKYDFNIIKNHYSISGEELCNQLYFIAGTNLRTIDTIMMKLKSRDLDSESIQQGIIEHCYPPTLWDLRAKKTVRENKELLNDLISESVKKNFHLISYIYRNINNISSISWINDLKPLESSEIRKVCSRHSVSEYELSLLVDKGYFSAPPSLEYLHMSKPLDLLFYYPKYLNNLPSNRFWNWISFKSTALVDDFVVKISNQLLQDVVALSIRMFTKVVADLTKVDNKSSE